MIIYSELTGLKYDSEKECLKAEYEYKQQKIDDAYHKVINACAEFFELIGVEFDVNCDVNDEDEDENDVKIALYLDEDNENEEISEEIESFLDMMERVYGYTGRKDK